MKMREPDSSWDKRQQAQVETRDVPPERKCSNVGVVKHLHGDYSAPDWTGSRATCSS